MSASPRIALVTSQPAPYRIPVWDAVASRVGALNVYSCTESTPNRIWELEELHGKRFEHSYVPGWCVHVRRHEFDMHANPLLLHTLSRLRPDSVVITGYQTLSFVSVIAWARAHGVPLVLWWESHAGSSRVRRGPIAVARRFLINRADAYVTVGRRSTDYLLEMGVLPERISQGVNAVDVDLLLAAGASGRVGGSDNDHVKFLFVGQLIERKGVRELIAAFERLPHETTRLRIVGYGPLEEELRQTVRRRGLHNVEFAGGTKTLAATAQHYAWADFLVMPSLSEVWGLVVNEALACGLPVLASRQAGCTPDLVDNAPARVGLTFDAGSVPDLARALREAATRRCEFDRTAVAEWGQRFTPTSLAHAITSAIETALAASTTTRGRRASATS